jgi:hypothetical protein
MKTTLKKSKTGRKNEYLVEDKPLTHDQIYEALMRVQDDMERSQLKFILLDELAHQMATMEDPQLEATEISIGILKNDFTESGSATLRSIVPDAGWKDIVHGEELANLSYQVGSVPVVVWFIHNKLDVFTNPDVRFYYSTEFKIPNPFKTYWRKRDMIR